MLSVRNVLSNPLRYRIFEEIARRPCSTQEEVAESLRAHVGVVGFHVRTLAAYGAVSACEGGKLTADMELVRSTLDSDDLGEGESLS